VSELGDNVVSIAKAREQRSLPKQEDTYLFTLHVYETVDGSDYGCIQGYDAEMDGNELREVAGRLERLASIMRDQAAEMDPEGDGFVLGRVMIWENSRVQCWASNKVETAEQVAWLHDRLDDAKGLVHPLTPHSDN
jgi:hypothetical protein